MKNTRTKKVLCYVLPQQKCNAQLLKNFLHAKSQEYNWRIIIIPANQPVNITDIQTLHEAKKDNTFFVHFGQSQNAILKVVYLLIINIMVEFVGVGSPSVAFAVAGFLTNSFPKKIQLIFCVFGAAQKSHTRSCSRRKKAE